MADNDSSTSSLKITVTTTPEQEQRRLLAVDVVKGLAARGVKAEGFMWVSERFDACNMPETLPVGETVRVEIPSYEPEGYKPGDPGRHPEVYWDIVEGDEYSAEWIVAHMLKARSPGVLHYPPEGAKEGDACDVHPDQKLVDYWTGPICAVCHQEYEERKGCLCGGTQVCHRCTRERERTGDPEAKCKNKLCHGTCDGCCW